MTKSIAKTIFLASAFILNISCGGGGGSISTIQTTDAFDDSALDFNPKIDILWVVDPSRSMKSEIETVQNNIQEFIGEFITKGYDYQMGVISTAAWSHLVYQRDGLSYLDGGAAGGTERALFARLHRGDCTAFPPAVEQPSILSPGTASDIGTFINKFKRNFDVYGIAADTSGCGIDYITDYAAVPGNLFENNTQTDRTDLALYIGDERPLQSVETFLELDKSASPRFARPGAYLAVIIISDELDGSRNNLTPSLTFAPNQPGVAIPGNHTAQQYIDYIREEIKAGDPNKFGIYSFVDLTLDGINIAREAAGPGNTFDINANREAYIQNLNQIRADILTNATTYALKKEPIVSTISVQLLRSNGTVLEVPASTGPGVPGWVYEANIGDFGSIAFIGSDYIPGFRDGIIIDYTPRFLSSGQIEAPFLRLSNARIPENSVNGTPLGTVTLVNRNLAPTDVVSYSLVSNPVGSFTIDSSNGQIVVADSLLLNTEQLTNHQLVVSLTVTTADATVLNYERTFIVSILDLPDTPPVANPFTIEVSEASALANGDIIVTGNSSLFVSGVDGSEVHTYAVTAGPNSLPAPDLPATAFGTLSPNTNGTFTYTINRSDLDLIINGPNFQLTFEYTVTGTNTVAGSATTYGNPETSSALVNILITPTNTAPRYLTIENPINGGMSVTPSTEGIQFGLIPLQEADVTVSGIVSGSVASLIGAGSANLITASNASGYHEVAIAFPDDKLYEVSCVRIYRTGSSSLENAIYQIQTGGLNPIPITREVFPVGTTGNSNRPKPTNAQAECDVLSASYFTIYTDRNYIGGSLRLLRPFGAKNRQNETDLRLSKIEVYGTEARTTNIDLLDHFRDEDIALDGNDKQINGDGDTLTFYVTDAFGEGPAPGWANIPNNLTGGTQLQLLPSSSVNDVLGILAVDSSGFEAFTTIQVIGSGGGSVANAPPISLLKLDDTKRGGLSMRRWGGIGTTVPALCLPLASGDDNIVGHIEIDNFLENPFSSTSNYYDILDTISNPEQAIHNANGDVYSGETENGWCSIPVHEDNKYPTASSTFCGNSLFNNANNIGKIIPCLNSARSYGEVYSGYFVPAVTGVYKFRTRVVDNTVLLRIAPTEYAEDTTRIFLANWQDARVETILRSLIDFPTEDLGSTAARNSEFAGSGTGTSLTNYRAIPYDTNIFYDLNGIPNANNYNNNYTKGYMFMTQGNVYAFEMRFGEGGGGVFFEFQFDRRDLNGSVWDGWKPMDASVVVPDRGVSTAHTPFVIPITGLDQVVLEARDLFYDAELDLLEYSARLVNADGSVYSTGQIIEIGLSIGLLNGSLSGTLTPEFLALPTAERPRIVFRATERNSGNFAESLPIKLQ